MRSIHIIFFISLFYYFNDNVLSVKMSFLCKINLLLQSTSANSLIILIGNFSDPSITYIMGCRSVNKQFWTDSFHNVEGQHMGFQKILSTHPHMLSSDHSTTL